MNWDTVKGQWKQVKGEARKKWGKLSNDDLDVIDGEREKLVGKLQEAYGHERDKAEAEADAFLNTL